ncbi:cilia- and flagella-associated protein 54 [Echeneis naucrates]|uniref:cilia- and flagella-associated protein 54 n=1 Tax=Echeneis naucrates TaxID=173247 RepID=UPI0011133A14|nr:cilia- and flagella-associated protein 54 [Echeneis naucrates]
MSQDTPQSTSVALLARDLHLELDIIYHRASLKLLQLNAVSESELLDRIKKNKVSKALFLVQKARLLYNSTEQKKSSKTKRLLEEASILIEKAGVEERRLHISPTSKTPTEIKEKGMKDKEENPPPAPILLSSTDHSITFVPAPYNLEGQVCWYQLCGCPAEGTNLKVRLGDTSLPGTGNMIPSTSGQCVLRVEGLVTNQKYIFAVAAYNSQGRLLGNTIGSTTFPLLASMPVSLLSAWAHLAQVAFQTEHYALAERASRELWNCYTYADPGSHNIQDRLATTRLNKQALQHSSSHLCQLFLTSIFIETEINIQQGSLFCDSFIDNGPFIWVQDARLAECDRMLVAMDLAMCLNDGMAAVQGAVSCYGLLAPLIFHQIPCNSVIEVLKKCLMVLEVNAGLLKQKWTGNISESLMHMIACISYYLSKSKRDRAANKDEKKINLHLKALYVKDKNRITSETSLTKDNEILHPQTGCEGPNILHELISGSPLNDAYHEVMKIRRKSYFIEYAALLLQRTMTEGHPDLVLKERQIVEHLLTMMSSMVQRHKRNVQLRNMCCEERVWRSQLNYIMAQAHIALLYQGLDLMNGGALQHRYSFLNPLRFSLAYSGLLVWRNPQKPSKVGIVSETDPSNSGFGDYVATHKDRHKKEDDSVSEESSQEGEDSPEFEQIEMHRRIGTMLLDSLNKAALHLRRAMVLAHRGKHWTTLQQICQTVWNQSFTFQVQASAHFAPQSPVIVEQLHTIFTQLLVLATDLMMDMLNRLGLWSLYDSDQTEEELESSLHFSTPLDDSKQVDLRWVRSLVLRTLELLHDSGKWENLAHFALLFNSYTRERYALITAPLLIHAQRRLLERISHFGGPAFPQPHHVKTQNLTGKEVSYRNYAGCQLLSGRTPPHAQQPPIHKKALLTNYPPQHAVELKGAEIQHSMSLVCVPLDVKDTLNCYRQALEKRPYCLQVFQHSRTLLLQLLAYTQPYFAAQLINCQSRSLSHSPSVVNFSPAVLPTPNIQHCDLTEEDFSTPNVLYSYPISTNHIPTVIAAYSNSIKYLHANSLDSLRVLALHEIGDLHFYNGNMRVAHSCWSKAVDCALQNSGAIEKWDGVLLGNGSLQQMLKKTGVWGCLHAAGLTAKIAQYILTSDISKRTKCCLFSAQLFKCVLFCSLAQPQADLQYVSHSIGDELLPGTDLFSEPHRVHLDTTVSSLNFVCHWLFTTGYYIMLLPLLALYLHFVGTLCRDVQRYVEGKILKIRALTELCLFTEAMKETVELTQGIGVLLPYGHYIPIHHHHGTKEPLQCDCPKAAEAGERIGVYLWLRCRLALVHSLVAHIHSTAAPSPGLVMYCDAVLCSLVLDGIV